MKFVTFRLSISVTLSSSTVLDFWPRSGSQGRGLRINNPKLKFLPEDFNFLPRDFSHSIFDSLKVRLLNRNFSDLTRDNKLFWTLREKLEKE